MQADDGDRANPRVVGRLQPGREGLEIGGSQDLALRRDPFERADENSNTYWDWLISHAYLLYAMQGLVAQQIEAFKKFPPRQKPASFNLDAVLRQLEEASSSKSH